jgi:cyanophycinase-like exopeptidase
MRVALRRSCVLLTLAACGCAAGGSVPSAEGDGGTRAAAEPFAPAPDTAPRVVFYPRVGNPFDDTHGSLGPGVVLMNGGLSPAGAFVWMHDAVDRARIAADVVVLCTRGDDAYSAPIYAAAPFNSVQTVLVPPGAPLDDAQLVAQRLASAEVVFLADNDVASYAAWAGGPIAQAIGALFQRGGVVAGAGGGAAALGAAVLTTDVDSTTALANPYDPSIRLLRGPVGPSILAGTLVDVRTRSGQRLGRLAALTARAMADGLFDGAPDATLGIGLDDGAALAIDRNAQISLLADADNDAWLVHGGAVDRVTPGQALLWTSMRVTRFDAPGESYEPAQGCGTAFSYVVGIDGAASPPFTPVDPYDAPGASAPCP